MEDENIQVRETRHVVMLHANYVQPGGEEQSFRAEYANFVAMGYSPIVIEVNNSEMRSGIVGMLSIIFNYRVFRLTLDAIKTKRPCVIYVNNLWPGLSSSPLWAAKIMDVPVVQAIRNYRLVAPSAKLNADGTCFICGASNIPWVCIRNRCYGKSRLETIAAVISSWSIRIAGRYSPHHTFLATSMQTKSLLVRHGMDGARIGVRPNFMTTLEPPSFASGEDALFVGRISAEKGILELVDAWPASAPTLKIIGDGPLLETLQEKISLLPNVVSLGAMERAEVDSYLRLALVTIIPSTWAEPFGRVAIESMSLGTPVMCATGGAPAEVCGDAGLILDSFSKENITNAFKELESLDMNQLRIKAHRRAIAHYNLSAASSGMAAELENLFCEKF